VKMSAQLDLLLFPKPRKRGRGPTVIQQEVDAFHSRAILLTLGVPPESPHSLGVGRWAFRVGRFLIK